MALPSYIHESTDDPILRRKASRILVVDDDMSVVRMLSEDLELEGYHVTPGYDGQMALQLARQQNFDLIILDVNMPMATGLRVFEILRTDPQTAKIPIIFVTGELSKDVYPFIADASRVAHVKKPLDLESFNSLVSLFLERYPAQ